LRVLRTATAIFGPVTLALVTGWRRPPRRAAAVRDGARQRFLIARVARAILARLAEMVFTVVRIAGCAAFVPALFVHFTRSKIEPAGDPAYGASSLAASSTPPGAVWFIGPQFAIRLDLFAGLFCRSSRLMPATCGPPVSSLLSGGHSSDRPAVRWQDG
jgi:hypothetical protein